MDEPARDNPGREARLSTSKRGRFSPVWLIPLAVALVGAWLLYRDLATRGPEVRLELQTAEGLEAGRTKVKVRDVPVGHVTDIHLAKDHRNALATVQMDADTASLLGDKSRFWVVKPRIGPEGVSGLKTLVSGAYIQLHPGPETSNKRRFTVADSAPARSPDTPGVTLDLVSQGDNTLTVGDPIVFQGQNVGKILSADFSARERHMVYRVFVNQPYAKLITNRTQFWLRSGIDFHLGSKGVDVHTGSLQSVLAGGITFGLPDDDEAGAKADDGDRFKLYKTRNEAVQDRYDQKIEYVVLFDQSVRGLEAGAPVEYRGLRIGTVEKVPFFSNDFFDENHFQSFKIPVLIAIEPQRPSLNWAEGSKKRWRQRQRRFFEYGLRARIKSSSLLSAARFIDLSFDADAESYDHRKVGGYEVFPSEPSQITDIRKKLAELTNKINALDFEQIGNDLHRTLNASSATMDELRKTTRHINKLLKNSDTQALPKKLNDTLSDLQTTLEQFQQGSANVESVQRTLRKLNETLDNAAPLMRTLRDHPDSLLFGRPDDEDPEPRARP